MIKSFHTYDAAIAFSTAAGYTGSKPFKRLTWHDGAQIIVWSVQIHWAVCKPVLNCEKV